MRHSPTVSKRASVTSSVSSPNRRSRTGNQSSSSSSRSSSLAALYVHKGSAESKDSDDRMEASLRRIEQHLGTLPKDSDQLPDPEMV